MVSDWEELSGV